MSTLRNGAARPRHGGVYPPTTPRRLGARFVLGTMLALAALLVTGTAAQAAQAGKLVAPVYPGAVPAVTGKGNDRALNACVGRCFLTKDPIEKVKAFYDKAVGPLKQAPQPYGQRSYGLLMEYGECRASCRDLEAGAAYSTAIGIHALGPTLTVPRDPAKQRQAYEMGGLGWNSSWGPIHVLVFMVAWTPDMQDPLMYPYKIGDVDALYKKYNRTQTYFYVVDAATGHDRAHTLADQHSTQAAKLKQDAMMGNLAGQQAVAQASAREGDKIRAEDVQDDPEFNRIMQRKPALNRQYMTLAQKAQQQMMAGNMDEAEKTMDESDRLLRSDPEMAALMKRYDERDQRREAVSAKASAQGAATEANIYGQYAKQNWTAAEQTMERMVKEGYSTYIVLDYRLPDEVAKQLTLTRDRAQLAQKDSGLHHEPAAMSLQVRAYKLAAQEHGIVPPGDSPEKVAAAREAQKPAAASASKASAASSAGGGASSGASGGGTSSTAAAPPQPAQQPAQAPAEQKPSATDQAKSGLKKLKKLF